MKRLHLTTPTATTVEIKRSFDAPVALVWRAYTEPALVRKWLTGPPQHEMPECDIDLTVGGTFRYVWEWDEDGEKQRMVAYGTFKEIEAERRLLNTETFEMWPDNETLVETVFTANGERTHVTMTLSYTNQEVRDAVLQTPMEEGLEASYTSLDALLTDPTSS